MDSKENFEHKHRPDHNDSKVKCSFNQLLCVEFDALFDVDVEIDRDSIVVTCGDGFPNNINE